MDALIDQVLMRVFEATPLKKAWKVGYMDQPSEENMWHGCQKCVLQGISYKDRETSVLICTKHMEDNLQSTRTIPG